MNSHTPATRRLPRPSSTTPLQCVLTDSGARRDIPATGHCTSFPFPPCTPPSVTIKGRGVQPLQGLDLIRIELHSKGFGTDSLSRPVCNPTTNTPGSGTRPLIAGRRVLLLGGPNQSNPVVSYANHSSPTHDRYKFTTSGREP
jgi:hypothetical protein